MEHTIVAHGLSFHPLIDEAAIRQRIRAMGRTIGERYRGQCPVFLAVLNGAFIFAADLVRACEIDCEIAFIKLRSYQGIQSTGEVVQHIGLEHDVAGRPVIIVEDIIDSGRTLTAFLPRLQELGPRSIEIATFLFKPDALRHDLRVDYVGFEITPRFVIGYGLDYDGLGRNLRSVYVLSDDHTEQP